MDILKFGEMLKIVGVLTVLGVVLGIPPNPTKKDIGPRIVGGEATDIENHPWQLALLYHNQQYCGAVALHPLWALTAAHCLEGVIVDHLAVRAGSSLRNSGGQVIKVAVIYVHPDFDRETVDYDFALLLLEERIPIKIAYPVALPRSNLEMYPGEEVNVTGWGLLSSNGEASEILQQVELKIVDQVLCQSMHKDNILTERMFCAGDIVYGGKDACQGDGGGPVVARGTLYGLVSWGSGCGIPYLSGVNARVNSVLEWIFTTIE